MIILTAADFDGEYRIARNNYTTPKLTACINTHEKDALYQLLGQALADLYIANLTAGVPSQARFLTIHNAFLKGTQCDPQKSRGIKDILQAYVFYQYITGNTTTSTDSGIVKKDVEAAKPVSGETSFRHAEMRYNAMLDSWDAIQWYCSSSDDAGTYPEFKGIPLKPAFGPCL